MIEVTVSSLAAHQFLHGMAPGRLALLVPAARTVSFPAGYRLFEERGNATKFGLIQSGSVTVDLYLPGDGRVVIERVGMGEILGWSWLLPPYQWAFGAITAGPVEAIEFDAAMVRSRAADDPELGHDLTQRLLRILAHRLQATRVKLVSGAAAGPDRSV